MLIWVAERMASTNRIRSPWISLLRSGECESREIQIASTIERIEGQK